MIYFIQGKITGLVKIGKSVDPDARLRDLQTGSPDLLKLLATADGSEKEFHRIFAKYRVHGEWFSLSDETLKFGMTGVMGCDQVLIALQGWRACERIFQERGERGVARTVRVATHRILAGAQNER